MTGAPAAAAAADEGWEELTAEEEEQPPPGDAPPAPGAPDAALAARPGGPQELAFWLCEPAAVELPRWAWALSLGLAVGALCLQQRHIGALHRRHEARMLQLVDRLVESSSAAHQTLAEQADAARQALATQGMANALLGGCAGLAASALLLLSDGRLKREVRPIRGMLLGGCQAHAWRWSSEARARFGLEGHACGVLAQEVAERRPRATKVGTDGYLRVCYAALLD